VFHYTVENELSNEDGGRPLHLLFTARTKRRVCTNSLQLPKRLLLY